MRGGGIDVDNSELRTLYVDLSGAPERIQRDARKRINHGRLMVQSQMRTDANEVTGTWWGKRFRMGLGSAVSSEMLTPLSAEIGIRPGDGGGRGSIAHIVTYGTAKNGPAWDHTNSLRKAEPVVVKGLAEDAEDDVLGGPR